MKLTILLWLVISLVAPFVVGWLLNGFDRLDRARHKEDEERP